MANPSLVGESSTKDVLWRRHERTSDNTYIPQAGVTFRSGATAGLPDFPVIPDRAGPGGAGDVFADPDSNNYTEVLQIVSDCRTAWTASAPKVTGLIAIHMGRFVDSGGNPTELLGLGLDIQERFPFWKAGAWAMVIDNAYMLDGSSIKAFSPADNIDKLLGHEFGHALSLPHGDGADNNADGILDNEGDTLNGPNLMQYQRQGDAITNLLSAGTANQRDRIREVALSHIPDREVTPAFPAPLSNAAVDTLGDGAAGNPYADIDAYGVSSAGGVTTLFATTIGTLPQNISGLEFHFAVDTDNDPGTGGTGDTPPSTGSGGLTATPTVFVHDGTNFVQVVNPGINGRVLTQSIGVLRDGFPGDISGDQGQEVQVEIPTSLLPVMSSNIAFGVRVEIDDALADLTFEIEQYPSGTVNPPAAVRGSSVTVNAINLPHTGGVAQVLLGPDVIATGSIGATGNASITFTIPANAKTGNRLITVSSGGTAVTADCSLNVQAAPRFEIPPTPSTSDTIVFPVGDMTTFSVRASDADAGDKVTISIVGVPVSLGATFVTTGGNPATGDFSWQPGSGDVGTYILTFTAKDNSARTLSSPPYSITIRVVPGVPPTFESPPTPPDQSERAFPVGRTTTFRVQASDPDAGDLVSMMVSGAPMARGASFVTTGGNPAMGDFSWRPGSGDVGRHELTFTATDDSSGQLRSTRTIFVRVFRPVPVGFRCNGLVATIVGSAGPDIILGTSGDDVIVGLSGDDTIFGRGGNDTICGDRGNDTITGGPGGDWIHGGAGNDMAQGNGGNDFIEGGTGLDLLAGGPGADLVSGGDGNDQLAGSGGNDVVYGGKGNDTLLGGLGDDILAGHKGTDSLDCGGGTDIANGGPGTDTGINCELQVSVEL